jgi:thiol-disulfide isomerase/thioredoxin
MKILRGFWGIYIVLALYAPTILRSQDPYQDTYVVYYFGATSCGYCNVPANIEKIKQIKNEFFKKYPDLNTKYVFVFMDSNIEEGLEFIKKYGYWDEVSIGSFYNNELALNFLNTTKIPGVPHIIVYRDTYRKIEQFSVPVIKERKLLIDLVGGTQIGDWISRGYPLGLK